MAQKCALIFVLGRYLFLEGHSFSLAALSEQMISAVIYLYTFCANWRPLLIYASQKRDDDFFPLAINDSCLVFDGRLVIDADFHTNDPCIRAAGPLTKFQRRYHAESWQVFNNHDNNH